MIDRPIPIEPESERQVDAGWSRLKGQLEERSTARWKLAWVLASIVALVSVSAGATMLVREIRERARRADVQRQAESDGTPAQASETSAAARAPDTADTSAARPASGATGVAQPSSQRDNGDAAAGTSAGREGTASGAAARRSGGGGSSPLAGMTPKQPPSDDKPAVTAHDVDIFAAGSVARARGDFNEALRLYERFVTTHPNDDSAGLAAMEAARILADHLEQPAKALLWAERAARLSPEGSMREDARARVVQLLGAIANTRCVTAQSDFVRDYPNSVHRERVLRACDR